MTATAATITNTSTVEQQRALIMQIMSMTPEQINLLPPQQRDQVLQLKQQIILQQQQQKWNEMNKKKILIATILNLINLDVNLIKI